MEKLFSETELEPVSSSISEKEYLQWLNERKKVRLSNEGNSENAGNGGSNEVESLSSMWLESLDSSEQVNYVSLRMQALQRVPILSNNKPDRKRNFIAVIERISSRVEEFDVSKKFDDRNLNDRCALKFKGEILGVKIPLKRSSNNKKIPSSSILSQELGIVDTASLAAVVGDDGEDGGGGRRSLRPRSARTGRIAQNRQHKVARASRNDDYATWSDSSDDDRSSSRSRSRSRSAASITSPSSNSYQHRGAKPDVTRILSPIISSLDPNFAPRWHRVVSKTLPSAVPHYQNSVWLTQRFFSRKMSILAAREARRISLKWPRVAKEYIIRGKRVARESLVLFRRLHNTNSFAAQRAAKAEQLAAKKKEETILEEERQQRKLDFLITQTELYSHFVSKSIVASEEGEKGDGAKSSDVSMQSDEQQESKEEDEERGTRLIAVPPQFEGTLKSYQHEGLSWLFNLYEHGLNGILADEMGLGKTVQAITLLAQLKCVKKVRRPALIISPTATLHQWAAECAKFVPCLKVVPYWGNADERRILRMFWKEEDGDYPFDVIITSYNILLIDIQYLRKMQWCFLVCDEAHAIKSSSSLRWKTLTSFPCKNRLLLTGTPVQNNVAELWSLLHFIMPSLFDNMREFGDWFARDIEAAAKDVGEQSEQLQQQQQQQVSIAPPSSSSSKKKKSGDKEKDKGPGIFKANLKLSADQLERLHKILNPFILRRIKEEVERGLVTKREELLKCEMSVVQKRMYKDVMKMAPVSALRNFKGMNLGEASSKQLLNLAAFSSSTSLTVLLNLVMQARKVCNHPALFHPLKFTSPLCFESFASSTMNENQYVFDETDKTLESRFRDRIYAEDCPMATWELPLISTYRKPSITVTVPRDFLCVDPSPLSRCGGGGFGFESFVFLKTRPKYENLSNVWDWDNDIYDDLCNISSSNDFVATCESNSSYLPVNPDSPSLDRRIAQVSCLQQCFVLGSHSTPSRDLSFVSFLTSMSRSALMWLVSGGTMLQRVLLEYWAREYRDRRYAINALGILEEEEGVGVVDWIGDLGGNCFDATTAAIRSLFPHFLLKCPQDLQFYIDHSSAFYSVPITATVPSLVSCLGQSLSHSVQSTCVGKSSSSPSGDLGEVLGWGTNECRPTTLRRLRVMPEDIASSEVTFRHRRSAPERIAHYFLPPPPAAYPPVSTLPPVSPLPRSSRVMPPSIAKLVSDSGKMTAMDSLLRQLKSENHRVLIYSQMTKMMDIIETYLSFRSFKHVRLDGSSSISERKHSVSIFQSDPSYFVFLLSTRAGGLGLNLTGADTVILYDSDWNPTMDLQAMDRAHRLGQTRTVTVYRLVMTNTVEERVLQRAREKHVIQRMVIDDGGSTPMTPSSAAGSGTATPSSIVGGGQQQSGNNIGLETTDVLSLFLEDDMVNEHLDDPFWTPPQPNQSSLIESFSDEPSESPSPTGTPTSSASPTPKKEKSVGSLSGRAKRRSSHK